MDEQAPAPDAPAPEPAQPGGDLNFDFSGLEAAVLGTVGSAVVCILAVLIAIFWAGNQYGRMATVVLGACAVLYFVWFTDVAKTTLGAVITTITPA